MNPPVYLNSLEFTDLKTRVLAPFLPRYKVLKAMNDLPVALRGPMRDLVMTLDEKFLFLRNAKCGCTSIAQLMFYYSNEAFYPRSIHRAAKGIYLSRYHWPRIKPVLDGEKAFLFTFVREPEARAWSAFTNFFVDQKNIARHNHMPGMRALGYDESNGLSRNFDIYLDYLQACLDIDPMRTSTHFRPQVLNIAFDQLKFDFIGKLEHIEVDLPKAFEMGGKPGFPPAEVMEQRFNKSAPTRPDLTPAQRARVRQIFAADFEAFGYD